MTEREASYGHGGYKGGVLPMAGVTSPEEIRKEAYQRGYEAGRADAYRNYDEEVTTLRGRLKMAAERNTKELDWRLKAERSAAYFNQLYLASEKRVAELEEWATKTWRAHIQTCPGAGGGGTSPIDARPPDPRLEYVEKLYEVMRMAKRVRDEAEERLRQVEAERLAAATKEAVTGGPDDHLL